MCEYPKPDQIILKKNRNRKESTEKILLLLLLLLQCIEKKVTSKQPQNFSPFIQFVPFVHIFPLHLIVIHYIYIYIILSYKNSFPFFSYIGIFLFVLILVDLVI